MTDAGLRGTPIASSTSPYVVRLLAQPEAPTRSPSGVLGASGQALAYLRKHDVAGRLVALLVGAREGAGLQLPSESVRPRRGAG